MKSPLNAGDISRMKLLANRAVATIDYLVKCDRCKFDVADRLAQAREFLASIEATLKEFGSGELSA